MTQRVLILDTSILCCWLQVPGKDTAGPRDDLWDHARIDALLRQEQKAQSTFVLPIAALIETGNHIAQAPTKRLECAQLLVKHLQTALQDEVSKRSPWTTFTDQSPLWEKANLLRLAQEWPQLAQAKLTIGDATIKDVAEYYARAGMTVEILTGDAGLKAYQPLAPVAVPRRRR